MDKQARGADLPDEIDADANMLRRFRADKAVKRKRNHFDKI